MTFDPKSLQSAICGCIHVKYGKRWIASQSNWFPCVGVYVVCHLDLDAEVDESPVDGEEGHVLAQGPELPALEGKVSVGFLKQNYRPEGGHLDGDLIFILLIQDVGDLIQPPLLPWMKELFRYLIFLAPYGWTLLLCMLCRIYLHHPSEPPGEFLRR